MAQLRTTEGAGDPCGVAWGGAHGSSSVWGAASLDWWTENTPRFFPLRSHQHIPVQLGVGGLPSGEGSQPALKSCGIPWKGSAMGTYMSSWFGGVFLFVCFQPISPPWPERISSLAPRAFPPCQAFPSTLRSWWGGGSGFAAPLEKSPSFVSHFRIIIEPPVVRVF